MLSLKVRLDTALARTSLLLLLDHSFCNELVPIIHTAGGVAGTPFAGKLFFVDRDVRILGE